MAILAIGMGSVSRRLRLLSPRQLRAIKEAGLHEEMRSRRKDEVSRCVEAVAHLYADGSEPNLGDVVRSLATNLRAMPGLSSVVEVSYQYGSTALSEDEYYEAMALWVIDNQLGDGLNWRPGARLKRRRRGRRPRKNR